MKRRRIGKREWSRIRAADRRRINDLPPALARSADQVPISAVMCAAVPWVREDLDLASLTTLLVAHGLEGVAVKSWMGKLVGLALRSDVDVAGSAQVVADIVLPTGLVVSPSTSLAKVAALLAFERIPGVAVVADDGTVLGCVFAHELLWWLAQRHHYLVRTRDMRSAA